MAATGSGRPRRQQVGEPDPRTVSTPPRGARPPRKAAAGACTRRSPAAGCRRPSVGHARRSGPARRSRLRPPPDRDAPAPADRRREDHQRRPGQRQPRRLLARCPSIPPNHVASAMEIEHHRQRRRLVGDRRAEDADRPGARRERGSCGPRPRPSPAGAGGLARGDRGGQHRPRPAPPPAATEAAAGFSASQSSTVCSIGGGFRDCTGGGFPLSHRGARSRRPRRDAPGPDGHETARRPRHETDYMAARFVHFLGRIGRPPAGLLWRTLPCRAEIRYDRLPARRRGAAPSPTNQKRRRQPLCRGARCVGFDVYATPAIASHPADRQRTVHRGRRQG